MVIAAADAIRPRSRRPTSVRPSAPDSRVKAFRQARRHTLLVRALRVLFPLAAMLSLAGFFFGRPIKLTIGQGQLTAPLPTFDGQKLVMENPRYEGVTKDGARFSVAAKLGHQDEKVATTVVLKRIEGQLVQLSGLKYTLVCDAGVYDTKKEHLTLSGNIKLTTSDGMTAYLKSASIDMKTHVITSSEPVRAESVHGHTIDASSLFINAKTKDVEFEGGVRTHFVPPRDTRPAEQVQ
jgi:lipopolysaccharide export system protein LptC